MFRKIRFDLEDIIRSLYFRDWAELRYSIWKLWSDITYPFYRTRKQVGVFFSYLPVLWGDRDWDGHYFLYLMRHKLNRMEKCIRNGSHVDCDKDADQIKDCITIIDRMIDDNYEEAYNVAHDAKWGELETWDTKVPDSDYYEWHSKRKNAVTEDDKEQERKEFLAYMEKAETDRQNDYNTLFGLIAINLRKWWD